MVVVKSFHLEQNRKPSLFFFFSANSSFFSCLLHNLLCELARHWIVVRELHMKRSPGSGDRVQLRLIVKHFGHWHLGLDYLILAPGVHALHAAATRVEITHDVA